MNSKKIGEKTLINLTPHPINLIKDGEVVDVIPAPEDKNMIPRLKEEIEEIGKIGDYPIVKKKYGTANTIPEPKEGVYYIVSALVASALKRDDLLVPNVVRNEEGQIIGADGFAKIN